MLDVVDVGVDSIQKLIVGHTDVAVLEADEDVLGTTAMNRNTLYERCPKRC